jgi:hypothetical protein
MPLPLTKHPRIDRVPVMRPVSYEVLTRLEGDEGHNGEGMTGKAVLLNISQGGMLLLMTHPMSVEVPLLVDHTVFHDVVQVRGLSEAVWTCPLFLAPQLHFVGIRFLPVAQIDD